MNPDCERVRRNLAEAQLLLYTFGALAAGALVLWGGKAVLMPMDGVWADCRRILLAAGVQIVMLGVFLGCVRCFPDPEGRDWRTRLGLRRNASCRLRFAPLGALGILIVAGGLTIVWQKLGTWLGLTFATPPNLAVLARLSLPGRILFLASSTMLAPVVEELFFRRVLFGFFRQWLPVLPATLTVAGLFAAAHGSLLQAPGLMLMGIFWQEMDRRMDSLYPSLLLHAFSNAWVALVILALSFVF